MPTKCNACFGLIESDDEFVRLTVTNVDDTVIALFFLHRECANSALKAVNLSF
jgi:hypothetical protein